MKFCLFFICLLGLGPSVKSQPFITDDFENSIGIWQNSFGGNTPNYFALTSSQYSIDNNSLQVVYMDNNNPFGAEIAGYSYGNSEESPLISRYFNTTGFYNLVLQFQWKCNGESDRDFGSIYFKTSTGSWEKLKNYQSGKGNEIQNESIILPKCSENSGFYIGFSFTSDNSFNFQPGLVVDNLQIWGDGCPNNLKPPNPVNPGNLSACYNTRDSVGLTATTIFGNLLRWYSSAVGCSDYLHEGLVYNVLPTENKTYYVSAFNPVNGCESNGKLAVNLTVKPLPTIVVDTVIDATQGADGSIQVTATGIPPFYYFWSLNNDPSFSQAVADISGLNEGNYQLFVTQGNGCKDSVRVVVLSKAELDIPGGISPNDDGYNDEWLISGMSQWTDYEVELRNMRGELVYKQDASDNPSYVPFDGKNQKGEKLPPGDYTYFLRSKLRKKKYSGILSIKYD